MTTAVEAVRAVLVADPAVAGLVVARIFANKLPQGTLFPAIVLRVVSGVDETALTGTVASRLSSKRIQIDCYAKQYLDAAAVAEAVNAVVSALQSPDLAAVRIGERDLWDDTAGLHNASQDFSVWL